MACTSARSAGHISSGCGNMTIGNVNQFIGAVNDMSPEQKKELAFTQEDREALERARNMPITFDIDCPETTPERAVKFRRVNPLRKTKTANPA